MKKSRLFLPLILLVPMLFVLSCAFVGGVGSIRIPIPTHAFGSGVTRGLGESGTDVSVTVLQNGVVLPKANYTESISAGSNGTAGTVDIGNLVPGPGYQIAIQFLVANSTYGTTQVANYAVSDPFTISAGSNTGVKLGLAAGPFVALSNNSTSGVAVIDETTPWYLDGTTLKTVDSSVAPIDLSTALPAGYKANSLTKGLWWGSPVGDELWVNTNKGIVPYRGSSFVSNFMKPGLNPSVRWSKAVTVTTSDENQHIGILYSGGGSTVGAAGNYSGNTNYLDGSLWNWKSFGDLLGSSSGSLVKSVTADVLNGVDYDNNVLYIATAIGAFHFDNEAMDGIANQGSTIDLSDILHPESGSTDVSVSSGGQSLSVTAISAANAKLFAGTKDGVFTASVDGSGTPTAALTRIAGTPGFRINSLSSYPYGGSVYTAASTDSGTLFIIKDNVVLNTYPSYAGYPGGRASFGWWKHGTQLSLLIAGDGGTGAALLDVASTS